MSSDATAEPVPILLPGFTPHPWRPISAARIDADGFIEVSWEDGRSFRAYGLWLAENSDGYGLDPVVRESNHTGSARFTPTTSSRFTRFA